MPSHAVHSTSDVLSTLRTSLKKIDQVSEHEPYIDLMLIHAPWGKEQGRANNWKALAQAQQDGWIRDIGVSNLSVPLFSNLYFGYLLRARSGVNHLKALPSPTPAINQIELHPWCQQREIVAYCQQKGIVVQAYCPIVRADKKRLGDPVVTELCEKHDKQPTQILIRWSLQKG